MGHHRQSLIQYPVLSLGLCCYCITNLLISHWKGQQHHLDKAGLMRVLYSDEMSLYNFVWISLYLPSAYIVYFLSYEPFSLPRLTPAPVLFLPHKEIFVKPYCGIHLIFFIGVCCNNGLFMPSVGKKKRQRFYFISYTVPRNLSEHSTLEGGHVQFWKKAEMINTLDLLMWSRSYGLLVKS